MSYHISRDGRVRPCRSKGPCPLGSKFDNANQAEGYSAILAKEMNKYENAIAEKKLYTNEEAAERGRFVSNTVNKYLEEGLDTESLYYNGETEEYSKARQTLHRKMLDKFHEKYENVPTDGKSVFSAGLPGAGKTTVLQMLPNIDMNEYATVSSDDFKEELAKEGMIPKIPGLDKMEASTLVHSESSYLADKFLTELSDKKKNIIYDFTCKDYMSTTRRMNVLKSANYEVKDMQFVFVDIPLETAQERAIGRYAYGLNESIESRSEMTDSSDKEIGGRYLPPEILEKSKSRTGKYSSINAEALLEVYESNKGKGLPKPIIYDNSGNRYINPSYQPEEVDFEDFRNR